MLDILLEHYVEQKAIVQCGLYINSVHRWVLMYCCRRIVQLSSNCEYDTHFGKSGTSSTQTLSFDVHVCFLYFAHT